MPIYLLKLRGALHVGEAVGIERETVYEWLPSDSLFGALVSAWKNMGADVEARLAAFHSQTRPFRLTSGFPWSGGIRFLPAPILSPETSGMDAKAAKRVRWLSASVFERLRTGAAPAPAHADLLDGGRVWVTAEERARVTREFTDDGGEVRLWRTYVVPRVAVDRASNASNLFHAGRVAFPPEGGLWFAAHGPQTEWIDDALAYLADAGLGGLRNYGHGAFIWQVDREDLSPVQSGPGISLARYAPLGQAEIRATIQRQGAAFRFVRIGGWCTDDAGRAWRRRGVRMIAEGALIPEVAEARGGLVDVRPSGVPNFEGRAVYRYAIPFFVAAGRFSTQEGGI